MLKIQIYGSGCDKCKQLAANVEAAAKKLGVEFELEKVTTINAITAAGIMMTPALAVNGKVVSSGKLLSPDEVGKYLLATGSPANGDDGGKSEGQEGGKAKAGACCCTGAPPAPAPTSSCCCAGTPPAPVPASACGCGCGCGSGSGGKKALTVVLLLFVLASVAMMVIRESRGKAAATSEKNVAATAAVEPVNKELLTVYYFHGNMRCMTCNKFEKLTTETLQKRFADQLANGNMALKIINVDIPENEHFVKDFQLTTKSVVLQKGDQVKNLEEIWTIIRQSDDEFMAYLEKEIQDMAEAQ